MRARTLEAFELEPNAKVIRGLMRVRYLWKLEAVSLEGGSAGSRVTAKKRRTFLMNLKEAVADLAQQVQQIKQMQFFGLSSVQQQPAQKPKPVEKEEAKAIQVKLPGRRSGCTCNTVQEFA